MRKGLIVLLAAVLVAAFALPASADFSTSGFVRIKARTEQNYNGGASSGLYIYPTKDPASAAYVEQRQRIVFDWKGENVGAKAQFEIDFGAWGDAAYQGAPGSTGAVSNLRNQGAALEGDSINLETKNFFIYFNVPNTSLKVSAGLLGGILDSYDGVILGLADAAGITLTGKMEPVEYRLGWFKFQEGTTTVDNDVDFYMAEAKFSPTKEAKVGLNFYLLRDASGEGSAVPGNTNLNSSLVARLNSYYGAGSVPALVYKPSNFYYIGLDGSFQAGPAALSGWAFYNTGKIENTVGSSTDVKAWAAQLRGDMSLGPGKFFLAGAYVSGTKDTDSDFKSPIVGNNYALAGSFPLYKWDLQILFPNGDDINASAALAYDVQNLGRGVMAFAAGYSQKFSDQLSGKIGLGYLADAENIAGSPYKKHKAFEVNANVNYALVKGIDLGLYGAFASLSDWGAWTSASGEDPTVDADDVYKLYARLNYGF